MMIRPMNDRIMVRRIPETDSKSVIIIPDVAQQPSYRGEILSVGPGKRRPDGSRQPLDVKPGEIVWFGQYTDFDNEDYVMIQEADIRFVERNA